MAIADIYFNNLFVKERLAVEKMLEKVPEGTRITIDQDKLDKLLFDTFYLSEDNSVFIKVPVWSGPFLRKLDLSNTDFSMVSWSILGAKTLGGDFKAACRFRMGVIPLVERLRTKLKENGSKYLVDYSGTNANIDLTTSYEAVDGYQIEISSCDFSGLDLLSKHSNIRAIHSIGIYNSRLDGAKLPINFMHDGELIELYAINSSLVGVDLSKRCINAFINCWNSSEIADEQDTRKLGSQFAKCDLRYSGINIDYDKDEFEIGKPATLMNMQNALIEAIRTRWVGCIFNGKLIQSSEQRRENAIRLRQMYDDHLKEFDDIKKSIASAIDGANKK